MVIDNEQKIKTLNDFCEKFESCRDCPLDSVRFLGSRCVLVDWNIMTESDLDRAYNEALSYVNSVGSLSRDKKIAMLDDFCNKCDCDVCPFDGGHSNGRCTLIGLQLFNDDKLNAAFKTAFPAYKKTKHDYWSNICDMQKKQTEKGIKKYGQVLEENTAMTIHERLEYLQEELIDGLMYIEHIKASIDEMLAKEDSK